MKLSTTLLQAIAVGVTTAALSAGCRNDDVKSGNSGQKNKKEKVVKPEPYDCPTCGMG